MTDTTVIRKASWVVAWDGEAGAHRYLRHADVAFTGNTISHVGVGYGGEAASEIDGAGLCVMPGLVNIHAHPYDEPFKKGLGDSGSGQIGEMQWFNGLIAFRPLQSERATVAEVGLSELLLSGVTTLVDLSPPYPGWFELAERSGLRIYLAPMYASATWRAKGAHGVDYDWAEDGGEAGFQEALDLVDQASGHDSGRMGGMIMPAQIDTCTEELLQKSARAARERGMMLQIHAAQLVVEFQEIARRHGCTPIQYLDRLGLLDGGTIVSHAILLDHHHMMGFWGSHDDLDLLAASGAHIAHCPTIFARAGFALEDFGRYRAAGVNLGIGTDTYPHNMLEEMRNALMVGRVVSGRIEGATAGDVFDAATVGGARALGRDDIGRLAPGAKADLVLVDLDHPAMKPLRDPLRSLLYSAAERAVRDVYVDGVKLVEAGRVLTIDYPGACSRLDEVQEHALARVPELDHAGRQADQVSPLTFPLDGAG